jgi:hypothetical protein
MLRVVFASIELLAAVRRTKANLPGPSGRGASGFVPGLLRSGAPRRSL